MNAANHPMSTAVETAKVAIQAALGAVAECKSNTFTNTYMNPVPETDSSNLNRFKFSFNLDPDFKKCKLCSFEVTV